MSTKTHASIGLCARCRYRAKILARGPADGMVKSGLKPGIKAGKHARRHRETDLEII